MSRKINILYMIDYVHGPGGTESHLVHLAGGLNKDIYSIYIVCFDLGETEITKSLEHSCKELIHIPVGRYYTLNALLKAFVLRGIIKDKKIDIVQTFHIKSDSYGAIISRISGVKRIVSSKRDVGDLKSRWHFFLNWLVRGITERYIIVAEAVGRSVVKKEKADKGKLQVIYNGVDVGYFFPPETKDIEAARESLHLTVDDFVLTTVAWMRPEKNYDVLFTAFERALGTIKNLKLIVVGAGPLLDFFKEYVRKKRLENQIIFAGSTSDVRPFLRAADVACLVPGGNEGFSNSIIEKMAMGLPLVVSDVGGNAEAVVDGYNGFVIPPNNSEKLTEALVYLARHPEERDKMGARSAQRVKDMFTLDGMVKAHEELYSSIMLDS